MSQNSNNCVVGTGFAHFVPYASTPFIDHWPIMIRVTENGLLMRIRGKEFIAKDIAELAAIIKEELPK